MLFESLVEWFIYSNLAMINIMAQYFENSGFSPVQIGALMAVIPGMALIANPFWFSLRNRIGEKKTLKYLILAPAILVWAVYLLPGFLPKLFALILFGFFATSIVPIGEAGVMESLMTKGMHLDKARLMGTVGFSTISLLSGFLFEISFIFMFIISTTALILAFTFSRKLKTYEIVSERKYTTDSSGNSRTFIFLLITATVGIMGVSFCGSFLPVLVSQKGFPESTVGISFAVLSICEVPFLLFAKSIIKKTGSLFLVATGIFAIGIRLFITPLAQTPSQLILTHVLHGWNYIVIYYSIFNYIHFKIPKKQANKAQAAFWMIIQGVGFLVGYLGGGILVELIGLINTYNILSIIMFIISAPLFIWYFFSLKGGLK
jgi:PPP family 3-phenylpropionic acid transporter